MSMTTLCVTQFKQFLFYTGSKGLNIRHLKFKQFLFYTGSKGLNIRHLKTALTLESKTEWLAKFVPGFIYVPKWSLSLGGNKF